jgi:hypothetical protein
VSKLSISVDRIEGKSERTARYYIGLVATLVGLAVGTHAATATTYSSLQQAVLPDNTLHAQTTGKPQMGGRMGRAKMRDRLGRSKMNGMGRSTMRSNTNSSMRTGKN